MKCNILNFRNGSAVGSGGNMISVDGAGSGGNMRNPKVSLKPIL